MGTCLIGCLLLGLVNTVNAASIAIRNPSFEDPLLRGNAFTNNHIPGWTGTDFSENLNFGVYDPFASFLLSKGVVKETLTALRDPQGDFLGQAQDGSNVAYIEKGAIFQVLTDTLAPNTFYRLSVDVGNSLNDPFLGYAVQLRAGGVVLAQATSPMPPQGRWITVTVTYLTGLVNPLFGRNLEIRFIEDGNKKGSEAYFDRVRLNATPIP